MVFLLPILAVLALKFAIDIDMGREASIVLLLSNPFVIIGYFLFLGAGLCHGFLGMKIIIEDYIHCKYGKAILINTVKFLSLTSLIAGVLGGLVIHIIVITSF